MIPKIEYIILITFFYAFCGWLMESVGGIIKDKRFINRGFLIGPICPVYGIGVAGITILLSKYTEDLPVLFILIIVLSGSLEYFTSYIMEKFFNARWWDYHNFKFNINGRICLETLIPFGLIGSLIVCKIDPRLFKLFDKVPIMHIQISIAVLLVLFIIDFIISFKIILSFKGAIYDKKDNTEEISNRVKEKTEEMTDVVVQKTGDAINRAHTEAIMIGRRIKLNKLKIKRKVKYTRKKIKNTAIKPIRALYIEFSEKRDRIYKILKDGKHEINKQIKIKQKAISDQIIENFKNKSVLSKRLIDAFPKLKINIKKKNKTK